MSENGQFDRSAELDQIATALAAAQGEFEVVAKTSTNPFFRSKFADLPSVVRAASPVLSKHGLSITQLPGHDEGGDTLTTILLHKSGQFLASTMRLRPIKNDPQSQGSATTYGRRYSYMAVLGLVADEDDDGNAASAPAPANGAAAEAAPVISAKAAKDLVDIAFGLGVADKLQLAISHYTGTEAGDCSTKTAATAAVKTLTVGQAQKLDGWLQRNADEQAAAAAEAEAPA